MQVSFKIANDRQRVMVLTLGNRLPPTAHVVVEGLPPERLRS
jgi:hypothetical protein